VSSASPTPLGPARAVGVGDALRPGAGEDSRSRASQAVSAAAISSNVRT